MAKIGLLVMGRKRPGFDPEWGTHIETLAHSALAALEGHSLVSVTRANDDASLQAALAGFREAGVEAPVVLQPTMSDGRLAPRLGQLWGGALVLWATPEKPDSPKVSSCSLVGTHVFAANLRQLQYPFELACGMPGEAASAQELRAAIQTAFAFNTLHRAKAGLIGYHAPGFIDMHAEPSALSSQFGIQLFHTGVQDLSDRMGAVPDADVRTDVETTLACGFPLEGVSFEDLKTASRSYLAIKNLVEEECLDALAIREWPEIPNLTGQWPYLSISRLLDAGLPVACEGDVDGALTSLMGCLLGFGPGYLTDWLEHDEQTITLWHGGCAPFSMCEPVGTPQGPRIGRHFNSDKPAVVNALLASGRPVTLCRIWRCDNAYHMMTQEAETIAPARTLAGTTGAVRLMRNVHAWFRALLFAGMPHHLSVFPGHRADLLQRLGRLLRIEIV